MPLFENRTFRLVLFIITVVVFWFWLQGFSGDDETTSATSDDAPAEDLIGTSPSTDTLPEPSPVVTLATPTEASAEAAESVLVYTIQSGDTLDAIAIRCNTTANAIELANPGLDPSRIFAGQEIRILTCTTDASAVENPDVEREPGEAVLYFIESGDTLSAIANSYSVSTDALIDANPEIDTTTLRIGQELVIPPIGTGLAPDALTPEPTPEIVERPLGEPQQHTVTDGDSLVFLAQIYQTTPDAIEAANPGLDPNRIFIGQVLLIPPPTQLGNG